MNPFVWNCCLCHVMTEYETIGRKEGRKYRPYPKRIMFDSSKSSDEFVALTMNQVLQKSQAVCIGPLNI